MQVSDFGLSKLIDPIKPGEKEVLVDSGKVRLKNLNRKERPNFQVPYRWVAPEALETRMYTHSTDVWAFGVTCWEILTYGQVRPCPQFAISSEINVQSPYQGMDMHSVLNFLQVKGMRLQQPGNCSVELYGTLLRCWKIHNGYS